MTLLCDNGVSYVKNVQSTQSKQHRVYFRERVVLRVCEIGIGGGLEEQLINETFDPDLPLRFVSYVF